MLTRLALAAALTISLGAVSAQALPVAPLQAGASEDVTLVADGCGRGFYRNAYGACRPMGRAPGVVVTPGVVIAPGIAVVPPVVVAPRAVRGCPPGSWRNRYGHCVYR